MRETLSGTLGWDSKMALTICIFCCFFRSCWGYVLINRSLENDNNFPTIAFPNFPTLLAMECPANTPKNSICWHCSPLSPNQVQIYVFFSSHRLRKKSLNAEFARLKAISTEILVAPRTLQHPLKVGKKKRENNIKGWNPPPNMKIQKKSLVNQGCECAAWCEVQKLLTCYFFVHCYFVAFWVAFSCSSSLAVSGRTMFVLFRQWQNNVCAFSWPSFPANFMRTHPRKVFWNFLANLWGDMLTSDRV